MAVALEPLGRVAQSMVLEGAVEALAQLVAAHQRLPQGQAVLLLSSRQHKVIP